MDGAKIAFQKYTISYSKGQTMMRTKYGFFFVDKRRNNPQIPMFNQNNEQYPAAGKI
jgi:hypothetical protein